MNLAVAVALVVLLCGCGGVAQSGEDSRLEADRVDGTADQCSLPVAKRSGGWFCPGTEGEAESPPGEQARTVLFNIDYVGIARERENARDGLQRCLEQPGTAVTKSDAGSPPIRQLSVHGYREDVRRLEQCLLLSVVNVSVERVRQQVDGRLAADPGRSLAQRYEEAPTWPGDPWTRNGAEVSRDELVLSAGAEHCQWQESAFVAGAALSAPRDHRGALWARDPKGVLKHQPRVQAEFLPQAQLPEDATWTGYVQDGVELWVAPSDNADYLYLVNIADRDDAERWVRGGGGCL